MKQPRGSGAGLLWLDECDCWLTALMVGIGWTRWRGAYDDLADDQSRLEQLMPVQGRKIASV